MRYLDKRIIIRINQRTVERHGGNFIPPQNFLNEAPLDYLIDAVSSAMFGQALYPDIHDKAGLYMFNIISNHVFQDGNKRTGLGAALFFLKLNGFQLQNQLKKITIDNHLTIPATTDQSSQEILIAFTLEVAAGKVSLPNCQAWFKENITPL